MLKQSLYSLLQTKFRLRMFIKLCTCFAFCFLNSLVSAQKFSFSVIPLGTEGGLNEANLSSYLVVPLGSEQYIALDAGTLYAGVQKAIANHLFNKTPAAVIRQNIKAYFISHPHLDHVAGLIINSPSDTTKNVYGSKFCLDRIAEHYFSWQTWANFTDEGEKPALNKYHLKVLDEEQEMPVEGTDFYVTAFRLSHAEPYQSSAFLIRKDSSYLLYFGDTGADTIEHTQRLYNVWQHIAPLIKKQQLKGIFLECSYPDNQPDKQLFGHLTPKLLYNEMNRLAFICRGKSPLLALPLIITHMKPDGNNEARIRQQITSGNVLGLHIFFPQQGKQILL